MSQIPFSEGTLLIRFMATKCLLFLYAVSSSISLQSFLPSFGHNSPSFLLSLHILLSSLLIIQSYFLFTYFHFHFCVVLIFLSLCHSFPSTFVVTLFIIFFLPQSFLCSQFSHILFCSTQVHSARFQSNFDVFFSFSLFSIVSSVYYFFTTLFFLTFLSQQSSPAARLLQSLPTSVSVRFSFSWYS